MQSEEPSGLMTTADLVTHLRMSRVTIWRKRRTGDFPQPCQIGHGQLRWSRKDVEDWLHTLPRFDPITDPSFKRSGSRRGAPE